MGKTKTLMIRVSSKQYELIVNKQENLGYATLSQFIRDLALKDDISSFKMLKDMHSKIMGCDWDGKNQTCIPRRSER